MESGQECVCVTPLRDAANALKQIFQSQQQAIENMQYVVAESGNRIAYSSGGVRIIPGQLDCNVGVVVQGDNGKFEMTCRTWQQARVIKEKLLAIEDGWREFLDSVRIMNDASSMSLADIVKTLQGVL